MLPKMVLTGMKVMIFQVGYRRGNNLNFLSLSVQLVELDAVIAEATCLNTRSHDSRTCIANHLI